MAQKTLKVFLTTALLISSISFPSFAETTDKTVTSQSVQVNTLVDLKENHWAFNAVKNVVQELGVMDPKTSTKFMGDETLTRYELAKIFFKTSKKLEEKTGKKLKVIEFESQKIKMTDVAKGHEVFVDEVVNDYGIMQSYPGKKFAGEEEVTRYELAFELNNYLKVLESKIGKTDLTERSRFTELTDLPKDHWANASVKDMVDKYYIMDGMSNNTFRGSKRLSRYEFAAILTRFVEFVDEHLVTKTVEPSPVPTVEPTVEPTEVPVIETTPVPVVEATKAPLNTFDIRLGGTARISPKTGTALTDFANEDLQFGPNAQVDVWFPKLGPVRLGVGGDAEYTMFNKSTNSRLMAGGSLNWRIFGGDSIEDTSLILGAGYTFYKFMGENLGSNHGPRARLALEIPIGSLFSIFADDVATYYPLSTDSSAMRWSNMVFAGVTIPATSFFSVQLGYKQLFYNNVGEASTTKFSGSSQGAQANLRFRF